MTRKHTKHIGIVAVSAEGAALCYRTICLEGASLLGSHDHPEVSVHTYPLADYMRAIEHDRWEEVGRLLLASAAKVIAGGAEILVCPDNTVHRGLDLVREQTSVPWLHIAEEVAAVAQERGLKVLGVLGTRYLMEGPVYAAHLQARGIGYEIPPAADRQRINTIIFDELVCGRITAESRDYFQDVIRGLAERGCDGVVLGCTEIPLLISEIESPLPAIDSTRTLARAALREALGAVRDPVVRVRPATAADIEAMHQIRLAVSENRLSDPLSVQPEDYRRRLGPPGISLVAESEGRVLGFAAGDLDSASIWALFVDPSRERRGIGRLLHDALVDALFASGATQLHLSTDPGTRAERLYRRAGWQSAGDTKGSEVCYRLVRTDWAR